jgi:STE24 endopeptidase
LTSGFQNAIADLTKKLEFSFEGVYVMDGSKRSSHSNAFFTGFGSTKRIVLFDTLINQQTRNSAVSSTNNDISIVEDEIIAILGHEIGHYKKRHIIWGIALSMMQTGILFYFMQYFITSKVHFRSCYAIEF